MSTPFGLTDPVRVAVVSPTPVASSVRAPGGEFTSAVLTPNELFAALGSWTVPNTCVPTAIEVSRLEITVWLCGAVTRKLSCTCVDPPAPSGPRAHPTEPFLPPAGPMHEPPPASVDARIAPCGIAL